MTMRMIRHISLLGLLALMLVGHTPAYATETAQDYLEAVKLYNEGHYDKAANLFETISGMGVVNGKLYYNAGNAWFKAGSVGRAMLWYERAMKLIPHDPDLMYNHDYVAGLLKDKVEDKGSPVLAVLFFWKEMLTARMIQWLALIFFLVFWILLVIRMFRSGRSMKVTHWIVLSLAVVFTSTAFYDFYDAHYNKQAIVLSDTVSVRSGLTDDSTELFVLHSGTRVAVDDERRGYMKIRFSGDKIGWVKMKDIEII